MYRPHDGAAPDPWDATVRITHWGIAGVVAGNALLTEGGSAWHVWLGWAGMVFLAVRLVWGFAGPAEARFAAFPPSPIDAFSHLNRVARRRVRIYRSHNPAGALMAYALWLTLAVVMATGVMMTKGATPWDIARQQAAVASGDWSALAPEGGEDGGDEAEGGHFVSEVHEAGGNLLLILAVIHLAGVAVESVALRRNLVRPMLFGGRR